MLFKICLLASCLLTISKIPQKEDQSVASSFLEDAAPYKYEEILDGGDKDLPPTTDNDAADDDTSKTTTLFLTENYATYYFAYINDNMGNNVHNSCGFVATALLLSFWDTYWDDNIIGENYDANVDLAGNYIPLTNQITSENTSTYVSPGIVREPDSLAYSSESNYHKYISQYADSYFHFKLMDLFMKNIQDREPGAYGMGYQNYLDLYNFYVYDYLGYTTDQVEIISSTSDVRNKTIDLVKEGIPVKLSIGGHAVVAYDYDEENDDLYCHFGWGVADRHVTIESKEGFGYYNLVAFKFKDDHHNHHSNNYTYINEYGDADTLCACSLVTPQNVQVSSGNYLDSLPTYIWQSLIHEKWHTSSNLYFVLSILNPSRVALYTFEDISNPTYTLNSITWGSVSDNEYTSYYIYVRLESPNELYWDEYYASTKFSKPKDYANKIQIKPSEWGFDARYYFADEGDSSQVEYRTTHHNINSFSITAKRLRCGYIEEQYINLSPRRENAGVAYLRLTWSEPVYSYMFGASFWSKYEYLDSSNGTAIVTTMSKYGIWNESTPDFDLLSEGLSTTRSEIKRFVAIHKEGIYGLEIYTTALASGDRNKGRICIDDIVLSNNILYSGFFSTSYPSIG